MRPVFLHLKGILQECGIHVEMRQHRPRDQEVTELPQSCRVDQVEAFMLRCWGFALYLTAPSAAVHAPCIPPPPAPTLDFHFSWAPFLDLALFACHSLVRKESHFLADSNCFLSSEVKCHFSREAFPSSCGTT